MARTSLWFACPYWTRRTIETSKLSSNSGRREYLSKKTRTHRWKNFGWKQSTKVFYSVLQNKIVPSFVSGDHVFCLFPYQFACFRFETRVLISNFFFCSLELKFLFFVSHFIFLWLAQDISKRIRYRLVLRWMFSEKENDRTAEALFLWRIRISSSSTLSFPMSFGWNVQHYLYN